MLIPLRVGRNMVATEDVGLSNKVLFRGVPDPCTAQDVSAVLQKYGPLDCICYEKGQGSGFAEFLFCGSAERCEKESRALGSTLMLAGERLEVCREAPKFRGSTDVGAFQQAFVKPKPLDQSLDVTIVRGHCTAAGIGMVAELAKAKTTTLVLWDRCHNPKDEPKVKSALKKQTYTEIFSEQKPDRDVMAKAEQYFSVGEPKCALVHIASDKIRTEASVPRPLFQVDELVSCITSNHVENISAFNAYKVYKQWVHANRACVFLLMPPKLCHEWDDDLATCGVGYRRIVKSDPHRVFGGITLGTGWTMGLQMTNDSSSVSAALAFASIRDIILSSDEQKNDMCGKVLDLGMPIFSTWAQQAGVQ